MKIIVISEGKKGNGGLVAEELMGIVKEDGREAHIYSVEDTKPEMVGEGEFYVFVSPTHFGGPHRKMKKLIENGVFPKKAGYGLITLSKKQKRTTADKLEELLVKRGLAKEVPSLHILENKDGTLRDFREPLLKFYHNIKKH